METKSTRPPTKRKVKSVGFKERPYVTARIRAELVGRLVGLNYTQVQKKMHSQGLSIKSLDDCVKFTQRSLSGMSDAEIQRLEERKEFLTKKLKEEVEAIKKETE